MSRNATRTRTPEACAQVQRILKNWALGGELAHDNATVATEPVTDAVRHCRVKLAEVEVSLSIRGCGLLAEVSDPDKGKVPALRTESDPEPERSERDGGLGRFSSPGSPSGGGMRCGRSRNTCGRTSWSRGGRGEGGAEARIGRAGGVGRRGRNVTGLRTAGGCRCRPANPAGNGGRRGRTRGLYRPDDLDLHEGDIVRAYVTAYVCEGRTA